MDSLRRLEEIFAHFPGIGPRQARRFAYYLLNKSPSFIKEFTQLIEEVRAASSECEQCHRIYFSTKSAANKKCSVCADTSRNQTQLMIVARDSDFDSIEKSRVYTGLYFILGGIIPVLDTEPEKRIRLQTLLSYITKSPSITEIILSLNTTPDGEHTAQVLTEAIQTTTKERPIKITLLGRGLSTGAELEYVDGDTIRSALENRH